MANALQDLLRSVASGGFDITAPGMRTYQMARQGQQQTLENLMAQRAFAERQRQFNTSLPIRGMTAAASALSAQTGAGALQQRIREFGAEPGRSEAKQKNALARIAAQKGDIQTVGEVAGGFDPTRAPELQGGFEKRAVGLAGRKEGARQTQITAGSKARAEAKAKAQGADPILRRQLIGNIAKAFRSRSIFETQAMDPMKQGPQQGSARQAVQRELAFALQEFRRITGEPAPNAQEMAAAMQEALSLEGQAPQQQQQQQLSPDDLKALDELSR